MCWRWTLVWIYTRGAHCSSRDIHAKLVIALAAFYWDLNLCRHMRSGACHNVCMVSSLTRVGAPGVYQYFRHGPQVVQTLWVKQVRPYKYHHHPRYNVVLPSASDAAASRICTFGDPCSLCTLLRGCAEGAPQCEQTSAGPHRDASEAPLQLHIKPGIAAMHMCCALLSVVFRWCCAGSSVSEFGPSVLCNLVGAERCTA